MIIHYSLYMAVMFVQVFGGLLHNGAERLQTCHSMCWEFKAVSHCKVISVKVKLIHITYKADENIRLQINILIICEKFLQCGWLAAQTG